MTAPRENLLFYNSLTRRKEPFEPLNPPFVGTYVCGPTVYGDSHLGHAKSYITFDVVVRHLRFLGYKVRYVQNITDVGHLTDDTEEDKILKQSRLEQIEPMEVVEKYTRSYFDDMDALNVLRPDISPRASGHVPEQIAMIEELFEKGAAYENGGNVYFSVEAFPDYGKLSGRKVEDQQAGARVGVDADKRNPADFLLWRKASADHILKWNSPWGPGYPGWHLECSVMARRYLGDTIDIHGGGLENQFPHHECEIAQSETATGKPFVRVWLHNNMVTRDGQKMGKSLGNFITLKDAFTRHPPSLVRFFLLRGHYRSPIDYSADAIHAAQSGLGRLRNSRAMALEKAAAGGADSASDRLAEATLGAAGAFVAAMNDDINTPNALAAAFDFVSELNKIADSGEAFSAADWNAVALFFDTHLGAKGILGIDLEGETQAGGGLDEKLVDLLLTTRRALRDEKNFALGDTIRDGLLAAGIEIKDTKDGTTWKRS